MTQLLSSTRFPNLGDQGQNPKNSLIRDIANQHHQAMTITTSDGFTWSFELGPQAATEDIEPIETEVPTTGGFFTFRWLIAPSLWNITCYSGLEGLDLIAKINHIVGDLDAVWYVPYLQKRRNVKIMSIRRSYGGGNPYGFKYNIKMRENLPFVSLQSGPVTQFRTSQGLVANSTNNPQVNTGTGSKLSTYPTAGVPGIDIAASNIIKNYSHSGYSAIYQSLSKNSLFPYGAITNGPHWGINTPIDTNGNPVQVLYYDPNAK